jgi:hypothetical protein
MEQIPSWKDDSRSVDQEITRLLGDPKAHYRFQKRPPLGPILIHLDSFHVRKNSHHTPLTNILILYLDLLSRLPNGPFPSDFMTNIL